MHNEENSNKSPLSESEERLRLFSEFSKEGIIFYEYNRIIDSNEQFAEIFGYNNSKEIIGNPIEDFILPEFHSLVSRLSQHPYPISYDVQGLKKSGGTILLEVRERKAFSSGRNIRIFAFEDVTHRKEHEEKLISSAQHYKSLFDHNLVAVFRSELGGKIHEFNLALVKFFGYDSVDEIINLNPVSYYLSSKERDLYLKELLERRHVKNYQIQMLRKNGEAFWALLNVILVQDPITDKDYVEGTLIDITENKHTEQALLESESNYRNLIEHSLDGILIYDEKGQILFANQASLKILERSSLEEINGKSIFSFTHPDYHEQIRSRKIELDSDKDLPFLKLRIRQDNEKNNEVEIKTNTIKFNGKPAVKVVMHDISLQRELEKEQTRAQVEEETNRELKREIAAHIRTRQRLNANQKYVRLLIDSSMDMIFACDREGKISEFNLAASKAFGYEPSEVIGKSIIMLYPNLDEVNRIKDMIFVSGNFIGEALHIKKSGESFPVYKSSSLIKNDKSEIIGIMSVAQDITARIEVEKQLKKSVLEKEILLKEIHHRVKNNMQVISSILKLQTAYVKDKKTIDILNECRDRIASMAFIHATLYMTKDFENINFAEYIGNLAGNLQQSYVASDRKILLRLDIPTFFMHIDDAIPCGLIINELLSNSFKYAFNKKKKGTVGISVKVKKENIILAAWDDGQGFPSGIDYKNTKSLGLQLVMSLIEQIQGNIKLFKNTGTKFIISFRKSK